MYVWGWEKLKSTMRFIEIVASGNRDAETSISASMGQAVDCVCVVLEGPPAPSGLA
jgi:hypothetical protein